MNKVNRKAYRDWFWIIAVSVFVVSIVEGLIVYLGKEAPAFVAFRVFQNAVKAYKLDPDIKLDKAISIIKENENIFVVCWTWLYCLAIVTAPFCTISGLLMVLEAPFKFAIGKNRNRKAERVLVWGTGENKKRFVSNIAKEKIQIGKNKRSKRQYRVYSVEEMPFSKEKQIEYMSKGIRYVPSFHDKGLDLLRHGKPYDYYVFCDENFLANFAHLKQLEKRLDGKKGNGKVEIFFVTDCTNHTEIITRYYEEEGAGRKDKYELNVYDLIDKATGMMLNDNSHRIYRYNNAYKESTGDDYYDVHMGIVGFGEFGQKTLLKAMNLAVFSADSCIVFDVFDKNVSRCVGEFQKHFSINLRRSDDNLIEGGKKSEPRFIMKFDEESRFFGSDGSLIIRFWECDVDTLEFMDVFDRCAEDAFTYVVIALDTEIRRSQVLNTVDVVIENHLKDGMPKPPIVVRSRGGGESVNLYIDENKCTFSFEDQKDIYSMKAILNNEIIDGAKKFNYLYNVAGNEVEDDANMDDLWKGLNFYSKLSSIAQYMHQDVKENFWKPYFCDPNMKDLLQKIEHRRWNYYSISQGFSYADVKKKDLKRKVHPNIMPYERLKREFPEVIIYDYTPYRIRE